jgi:uncharacterized protein (DUF1800 family)
MESELPVTTETSTPLTSRRSFFALGAGAAAAMAATRTIEAQIPRGRPAPFSPTTPAGRGADASADWKDPLLRLVRRITMGLNPEEVALARRLGYTGYLNYHLDPNSIDDSVVEAAIATALPMTNMTAAQLAQQDGGEAQNQLSDQSMYRAAFSKRQLRERMVDFWTDHFTIYYDKVGYLKIVDDRDVIRANALTKFPQLLKATSRSAAMLVYLDQNRSQTPTPNQNYAREIMELHTLGVNGGYSQTDVAELSRILTGWTTTGAGAFTFNANMHDRGAKTFLGRAFPAMAANTAAATQLAEGDAAIQMLVDHPSTAAYIALKLSRWLLAYSPPQSVVDAATAVYLSTGGDIPSMIRTILTSKNLMASPAKYKRPFHLAASTLRAMGAQVANVRSVRQRADQMGMPIYFWQQPNGYPDRIDWWSGLVLDRWSFMVDVSGRNTAAQTKVDTALFRSPDTAEGVVAQINTRMYGGEIPVTLKSGLLTYLKAGTYSDARVRETLGLAASATQFQWF